MGPTDLDWNHSDASQSGEKDMGEKKKRKKKKKQNKRLLGLKHREKQKQKQTNNEKNSTHVTAHTQNTYTLPYQQEKRK